MEKWSKGRMNWTHAPSYNKDLKKSQEAYSYALSAEGMTFLPNKKDILKLYETMLTIRMFEERALQAAKEGEGLSVHPSTGHEAVAAGVCFSLLKDDKVVSNHRPLGHLIAMGGSLDKIMAELFGKRTGVNKGLGGELFWSEPSIGFVVSSMIVGACVPIATGVALSKKMTSYNWNGIVVCFLGDATTTNGAFHEGLTMASLYKLPILFVCENNGYSTNSPSGEYMPSGSITQRVAGYGIPAITIDGTDVIGVVNATCKARMNMMKTGMPYFIEALVPRIGAHKQELIDSRTEDIVRYAKMRDPIARFRDGLIREGILKEDASKHYHLEDTMKYRITRKVQEAVEFARKSKPLTLEETKQYVY